MYICFIYGYTNIPFPVIARTIKNICSHSTEIIMAQAKVQRKNPSQDKSRAYNNLKKSTTNIVEVAKSTALIFFQVDK